MDRTVYPEGFPALPEVPTARYTDKRMSDLEMEHLWRKTWLHACHISEIPNDGSYKLFEQVGLNVIVTRGPGHQVRPFPNISTHPGSPVLLDPARPANRFGSPYTPWAN